MEQFVPDGTTGGSHSGPPARRLHPLAYGIERIGLIALRAPLVGAIIFALLVVGAVFGLDRLKVDDSLSQLFRSDTPEFKQYRGRHRAAFRRANSTCSSWSRARTCSSATRSTKLRDARHRPAAHRRHPRPDLAVLGAPAAGERPAAGSRCFPEPLPTGAAYDELIAKVMSNEIIRGKLLSDDGELALIVLALDPSVAEGSKAWRRSSARSARRSNEDLAGTDLTVELSGVPVMQLEIRNAVERDRLVYNAIGFLAGCLIAIIFFRRVSFMIVAAGPPLTAILLTLGALGWLDFRLNMFLNVMTPLIMVISFSDSMQLTFAARDRLIAGESKYEALRNAILVVGPACVLTHATAGLSFVALLFSNSDLIRTFGRGRHHRDRDRPRHGADAGADARHAADPQGDRVRRQDPAGGRRRPRAAPVLRLDRRTMVTPGRALQPRRRARRRRARLHLRQPAAALPARRPGARQGAGGRGEPAARRQAHRRQSDRRADRIPTRRLALFAADARDHRRRACRRGTAGRRRQCVVARDAAALAAREGRHQPTSRR